MPVKNYISIIIIAFLASYVTQGVNTIFGEKNGFVSNFSIMDTDKWAEKYKIDFLKGLFLTKNE